MLDSHALLDLILRKVEVVPMLTVFDLQEATIWQRLDITCCNMMARNRYKSMQRTSLCVAT